MRFRKIGLLLAALVTVVLSHAAADPGRLTEGEVRRLYRDIVAAFNRGDIESVLAAVATDARLETRTRGNRLISLEPFDKNEYRRSMRELWASVTDYHMTVAIHAIHVQDGPGNARVLHTTTERWRDADGWQVLVTHGHTTLVTTSTGVKASHFVVWESGTRRAI